MKVAILCGGKGTRLAELTEGMPKGLIPIGGRPIVWHIMKYFEAFGHRDFVLLVGYRAAISWTTSPQTHPRVDDHFRRQRGRGIQERTPPGCQAHLGR